MPNHIHLLLRQKAELGAIMRYIKAKSAIEINKALHRHGPLWARDYYDKAIRDEKHLERVYHYIMHNPLKAELLDAPQRLYSLYER